MRFRAFLLVSATWVILLPVCAFAQQADPADTPQDRGKEIVVTAPREADAARETQKQALNVIDVQSAESIAKYPDFNAAEALSRIPGISLSTDTGEGRFVNIRGIDGNLNGATYGGVVLLNTNPGGTIFGSGRAVEFDTIPTGAIDGIVVTKTGMPNHDAEGLGGTIELTPRSAANVTRPFAQGAIGYGYEPAHHHGGPLNLDLAVGARFGGVNKPFSFVLTGSRRDDRRGFDDIEEDYIDDPTLTATSGPALSARQVDKALADIQLRRYDYHRRRFGYGGDFEYTPNDDHQYYIRGSVAGYVESALKNRLTYDDLDGAIAVDPSHPAGYATTTTLSIKGTNEEETHRNQVYVVGGRDRFDGFAIDYRASYSRATFNVSRNYSSTFNGPGDVGFAYDNITNANFPALAITDGTDVDNPALYRLKGISNSTETARDREWAYAANAIIDMHLIGDTDHFQFGGEVRLRSKVDTPFAQDFDTSAVGLDTVSNRPITNFYGDRYTNGPQIDERGVVKIAGAAPSDGLAADLTGYFHAVEDIYAGYAMYTFETGHLGGIAGVRVENTRARYASFSFDQDGNNLGPQKQRRDYTNAFPTVQLRYDITTDFLVRATYSTGIGRPGFAQVAQPVTIDRDNDIITIGNPALQPTTGNNFDLSIERYLPHAGIISFGLFDKLFDNYVVPFTRKNQTDPRIPGVNDITVNTFDNVPSAYARGVEAAYDQRFAFLPAPFDGLGINGNVTYVDSQVELRTGEKRQLPATSEFTWNAAGYYEAHGVQLRLAAQYVGSNLFGIGDSAATDVYQSPRTTLDFTSSLEVHHGVQLYFNVKNITNAPLRIYEGSSGRPIQREFYDETYEGGIKFAF